VKRVNIQIGPEGVKTEVVSLLTIREYLRGHPCDKALAGILIVLNEEGDIDFITSKGNGAIPEAAINKCYLGMLQTIAVILSDGNTIGLELPPEEDSGDGEE
jgi:hypothetical protein